MLRRVLEGIYPSAEREKPKVGKRWSAVLDRALARLPGDRYEDALAMQAALVGELKLLGVDSPRAELEAWFDDPAGYAERREAALIAKLCELGRERRARGDALAAAAHFNRALAYAPHDPALLKIVATMHRARASRDLAARILPLVLVSAALGTGAFFVTRALRRHPSAIASSAPAPLSPAASPATQATEAPVDHAPPTPPHPRSVGAPLPHPAAVKTVERKITIGATYPQFGLLMAIDGVPQGEAHEGLTITLDGKPHDLRFSCMKDECEPLSKSIAAGDESPVSFPVTLTIKPASLVVEGDPSLVYGIEEFPSVGVRVGVPVSVPIKHGNYVVHVVERTSGRRVTGTLNPGREAHVPFSKDPPPAPP